MKAKSLGVMCLFFFLAISQIKSQSVSGKIIDQFEQNMINAEVYIVDGVDTITSGRTNIEGKYYLELTEIGSFVIHCRTAYGVSHKLKGFVKKDENENITYDITIEQNRSILNEDIVILKKLIDGNTVTLTPQDFEQMPGSYDDPSRLLLRIPTVSTSNDQSNFISVKGLPPHMVRWSIHGTEIVNPNNLSNAGTLSDQASVSAGGVNMINARMMDRYQFHMSPLGDKFYNSLTGNSDVRLKAGSDGFNFSLGLLGTEFDYSRKDRIGPKTHYIHTNVRLSTLGLLGELGVDLGDEDISFNDIGFLYRYTDKDHKLKPDFRFYIIGGSSRNIHEPLTEDITSLKDAQLIDFKGAQMVIGGDVGLKLKNSYFRTIHNISGRRASRSVETDTSFVDPMLYVAEENERLEFLYSSTNQLRKRIKGVDFTFGNKMTFRNIEYQDSNLDEFTNYAFVSANLERKQSEIDFSVGLSWLKALYPELRLSYLYKINKKTSLHMSSSFQAQSIDPIILSQNEELESFTSFQLSTKFRRRIGRNIIDFGLFYHEIFDLPYSVSSDKYTYLDGYESLLDQTMTNGGHGRIIGGLAQGEYRKLKDQTLIVGASYYWLQAYGDDGLNRSSTYNFRYTLSGSYNFQWKDRWNLGLGYHTRGGAIEKNRDYATFEPVAMKTYHRLDMKISYTWGKKYLKEISLDILNVLNLKNDGFYAYDPLIKDYTLQQQLGIIPILKWTVKLF